MISSIKTSTLALAVVVMSFSTSAQDTKDKADKAPGITGKSQDIIIRQKGDNTEKMTIVVDGDKVTINGKPVDEFSNKNVTVLRRNSADVARARARSLSSADGASLWSSNKAVLGVLSGKAENGVKINEITKESAAEKAGLQKGDVITKVGSKKIEDADDLVDAISEYKPNDKVDITYLRGSKENTTTATLLENKTRAYSFNINPDINIDIPRPNFDGLNFNFNRRPKIGLQIQDVEEGKGVNVKEVDADSPAAKAGLKEGDVITGVNGKDIAGVDDVRTEIRDIKEGDAVKLTYKRGGKTQTAELKFPKRLRTADL
jgi:serine protease Do